MNRRAEWTTGGLEHSGLSRPLGNLEVAEGAWLGLGLVWQHRFEPGLQFHTEEINYVGATLL